MTNSSCYLCKENVSKLLWSKGKYRIVKCVKCGFIYTTPIPSTRDINNFYKQFDYHDVNKAEEVIRSDSFRSIQILNEFPVSKKLLLDIGCGRGFFLDEARKKGWAVVGVDYSKKVTEYATKKLGLNVITADILTLKMKKRFSVISLNQIIEHFSNPVKLIDKCTELLDSSGLIYIATPNIESIKSSLTGEDFEYIIPPEHLGYYCKKTLTRLLEDAGFKILYVGSWSYRSDLAGIIKRFVKRKSEKQKSNNSYLSEIISKGSIRKRIKILIFDSLFCGFFYRLLNINCGGSNLEIIAQKV